MERRVGMGRGDEGAGTGLLGHPIRDRVEALVQQALGCGDEAGDGVGMPPKMAGRHRPMKHQNS